MKYWPLIWGGLRRKRFRTAFTLLSILVAFVLYGYLAAINTAFSLGVAVRGDDRMVIRHKFSMFTMLLPESHGPRIAQLPGVKDVAHATFFGGVYQDARSLFPTLPVEPEAYLRVASEFVLPEEQKRAWLNNRIGAVAGRALVEKYGWKIGDRIPLRSPMWRKADGSGAWEFELVGIYDGAYDGADTNQFLFRYDYFDEARAPALKGLVGWYLIRIHDSAQAALVGQRIDAEFANSFWETKTSPEKAFVRSVANQIGNIGVILGGILAAVFFTMLLVTANTMMQSVRERVAELAVLKTVGFKNGLVLRLVLAESVALAALGGGVGLALAWWAIRQYNPITGLIPSFFFPPKDMVIGVGYIAVLGLTAGLLPAVQAMRLRVVDAMRRV